MRCSFIQMHCHRDHSRFTSVCFSLPAGLTYGAHAIARKAVTLPGKIMSRVEQAAYTVLRSEGPIQIRHYPSMIVAEVDVGGDRRPAISRGFRMIAGYIFGANAGAERVAMTAPVLQQRRSYEGPPRWLVRFVMPSKWTMETLPQPTDRQVSLKAIPHETYAAITFSGFHFAWALDHQTKVLKRFMKRERLNGDGPPVMAFFDPPWTLPTRRRNEIMIRVRT